MNAPAPTSAALLWFRDDLRLSDNAAFEAALDHGPVTAVYVMEDPEATGVRPLGGASRWWLHHSLGHLIGRLAEFSIPLLIVAGDPREIIPHLARDIGAGFVSWNRRYHRPQRDLDTDIKEQLRSAGVTARSFPGYLLVEPWLVSTAQGHPYQVYTPFSRSLASVVEQELEDVDSAVAPRVPSGKVAGPGADEAASHRALTDLASVPTHPSRPDPDWTSGLAATWVPGEAGAHHRLSAFLVTLAERSGGSGYAAGRDMPGLEATSRLSPHLRFGEISPHTVWSAVASSGADDTDITSFHRELMWRDFAWHRLHHRPDLATTNVRSSFDRFPWAWGPGELEESTAAGRDGRTSARNGDFYPALSAWRAGTTGFPLVDAGMRQLWATGYMHNRVRMVVGSLLTKNLGIHWRHGEEWFWDTLVDADAASNPFNWQWVAGCGDDAAPYFRIFNPGTQAARYDPHHVYRNRWAPDSGSVDPIVDLRESRAAALLAYDDIRLRT